MFRQLKKIRALKLQCLEEIAYQRGFLDREEIIKNVAPYKQMNTIIMF
jgi:hypothetical protein